MNVQGRTADRRAWLWPPLLMVAIFIASSAGEIASPDIVDFDKLAHAGVFGLLATLVARTQPLSRAWLGFVVACAYGLADEYRQSFTPGRSVELADWAADSLGAAAAVAIYRGWAPYRRLLELSLPRRRQPQIASEQAAVPKKAA